MSTPADGTEVVSIVVGRQDLEDVIRAAKASGSTLTWDAADRIYRAIPEPVWEPTEQQITSYLHAIGYQTNGSTWQRVGAADILRRMHREGLVQ